MSQLVHIESTTSTNDFARRLVLSSPGLEEGTLVYADYQTRGRGQVGCGWCSSRGQNLLCTMVLQPSFVAPDHQFVLTRTAALAVADFYRSLHNLCPGQGVPPLQGVSIKWPNDVYYQDRKICGTLLECDIIGSSISNLYVGIGANINQVAFDDWVPNPASYRQVTGCSLGIDACAALMHDSLLRRYAQLCNGGEDDIVGEYMSLLYRAEGFHNFSDANGPFSACIADVRTDGRLLLRTRDGGLRLYYIKEVQFLPD